MAFDTLAERHAMVGLDYQPDGTGFDDAGSMLMATGWGEDIDSDGGEPPPDEILSSTRFPVGILARVARARR